MVTNFSKESELKLTVHVCVCVSVCIVSHRGRLFGRPHPKTNLQSRLSTVQSKSVGVSKSLENHFKEASLIQVEPAAWRNCCCSHCFSWYKILYESQHNPPSPLKNIQVFMKSVRNYKATLFPFANINRLPNTVC